MQNRLVSTTINHIYSLSIKFLSFVRPGPPQPFVGSTLVSLLLKSSISSITGRVKILAGIGPNTSVLPVLMGYRSNIQKWMIS